MKKYHLDYVVYYAKKAFVGVAKVAGYTVESIIGAIDISFRSKEEKVAIADDRAWVLSYLGAATADSRTFIAKLSKFPEMAVWLHLCSHPENRSLIDLEAMPRPTQAWLLTLTTLERQLLIQAGPTDAIIHARGEALVKGVRVPRQYRPQRPTLVVDNDKAEPSAEPSADLVSCSVRP